LRRPQHPVPDDVELQTQRQPHYSRARQNDLPIVFPHDAGDFREVGCECYRIFYRVENTAKTVFIARILHGRQNVTSADVCGE
jgi:plasmid stabilization system protein ParE